LSGRKPPASKPNNRLLIPAAITGLLVVYYATPFALAIASLGEMCPYSPAGTRSCANHISSADYADATHARPGTPVPSDLDKDTRLCKKRGIRYKGETAQGAKVCFTLTANRASWLEIGFTFDRASKCPAHVTGRKQIEGPQRLSRPGLLTSAGFRATIHGAGAVGVFSEPEICGNRTFRWTARQTVSGP
jgi:hypothetical protein